MEVAPTDLVDALRRVANLALWCVLPAAPAEPEPPREDDRAT